jgi:ArsR family transcriptional regulator
MSDDRLVERAALLRAVAHPVRLTILAALRDGPRCVTHIRELLDVPQPNVSQHLAVLRHCGAVASCRDGARRCYYLPRPSLVDALFEVVEGEHPVVEASREAVIAAAQRHLRA